MKIVAVICQERAESERANLSIHLATAAALAGHRTAIVDLDPQGTASSWGDLRQADEPEVISGQAARLPMLIEAARVNGADLIVIDTPPQADTIALTAAKVADIVLVPIRPAIWIYRPPNRPRYWHRSHRSRRSLCLTVSGRTPMSAASRGRLRGREPSVTIDADTASSLQGACLDGRQVQEAYPNETAAEEVAQLGQGWLCRHVDMPHKRTIPRGSINEEAIVIPSAIAGACSTNVSRERHWWRDHHLDQATAKPRRQTGAFDLPAARSMETIAHAGRQSGDVDTGPR